MYVLVALSAAADQPPVRCEAVWLEPTKTCPLARTLAATGTGKNREVAERAAQTRLTVLVREAAELQEIQYPARPIDVQQCADDVLRYGRLSCGPAGELAGSKNCYVTFEAEECIAIDPFQVQGPGWKVMEKGRDKMCQTVARTHQTSAPFIQKQCMVRCLEETLVRCP